MRAIGFIAASLLACTGAMASAQTFGPPITGMCLLSRTGAISASRAGQSMQVQLQQMQASLGSELARRRSGLEHQRQQLEERRNAIDPVEYLRQLDDLSRRIRAIAEEQNTRFITAQQRGQQQIDRALNDALAGVITRNKCAAVFERDHSYGWNNAMDITGAVTATMDSVLQTVSLQ